MARQLAPVVVFAYRRRDHLERVLEALGKNELAAETDLVVYSDAAGDASHADGVAEVRALLRRTDGFRSVEIVERSEHLGLGRSVADGVTRTVEARGRVIVLEDDHLTSPYFLRFMNDALDRYADEERVVSVSGNALPVGARLPETYFRRDADCWGWGTWARGWKLYEPDGARLLDGIVGRGLARAFDLGGAYPYTEILRLQVRGEVDSWAIRWQAAARLAGAYTLYPGATLVVNLGFDGSGTNSSTISWLGDETRLSTAPVRVERQPVRELRRVARLHRRYYLRYAEAAGIGPRRSWPRRVVRRLRSRLRAA